MLTNQEKLAFKSKGIIPQKQDGFFALRFLSHAGYFSAQEMQSITYIAQTYGNGSIGLTSRLTIEIPYIPHTQLDEALAEAKQRALRIGGGGPSVRAIMTCKGSVCAHGLIDTHTMALALEEQFFGLPLPGKFKISVQGCMNSYGKAQGNDLAIMPIRPVTLDTATCINCNQCIKVCDDHAFLQAPSGLDLDPAKCTGCKACLPVCPTCALAPTDEVRFLILIGGRMGRQARLATPLPQLFTEVELFPMVQKVLDFYQDHAQPKERFAQLITRIGLESVEAALLKQLYKNPEFPNK
ncbi:MAG: 4Fe-4S dicluster domain-containing protein [Cellulosilyticaceae bacterium]